MMLETHHNEANHRAKATRRRKVRQLDEETHACKAHILK